MPACMHVVNKPKFEFPLSMSLRPAATGYRGGVPVPNGWASAVQLIDVLLVRGVSTDLYRNLQNLGTLNYNYCNRLWQMIMFMYVRH